ncbi:MAG: rRNA maturation RNase YbeY [Clostridiales bacterium]|nr:rRNA maturation RNase YbeY [Clostridiales bacterium]
MKVILSNEQEKQEVSPFLCGLIEQAIHETLAFEGFAKEGEVSVTLTDNEGIHLLNKQYRGIDRPTDVLSFPLFDEADEDYVMLGDIVLSLEKARQQAEEYGHSFERETAFLCVHSVLHLLGYDHETGPDEEREMIEKQKEVMRRLRLNEDEKNACQRDEGKETGR